MWDFGTKKMAKVGLTPGMTLKSGDALKHAVVDRYVTGTSGSGGTLTSQGSGGTVARSDGKSLQTLLQQQPYAGPGNKDRCAWKHSMRSSSLHVLHQCACLLESQDVVCM